MSLSELKDHLANLVGHVSFDYNGNSCGVDPLALDSFDMWCGSKEVTVNSVYEVLTTKFFDGKSLKDIWNDITELDY